MAGAEGVTPTRFWLLLFAAMMLTVIALTIRSFAMSGDNTGWQRWYTIVAFSFFVASMFPLYFAGRAYTAEQSG